MLARVSSSALRARSGVFLAQRACLHATAPRLKKKTRKPAEDLFSTSVSFDGNENDADDLFSSTSFSEPSTPASTEDPESQTFQALIAHLTPRLGRFPSNETPIKRSALLQLIQQSRDVEQLESVVRLLKMFRESDFGRMKYGHFVVGSGAGDAFVARCLSLAAPEPLLTVLFNRPMYGINLTRRRLHRALQLLASTSMPEKAQEHYTKCLNLVAAYHTQALSAENLLEDDPLVKLALLRLAAALPPSPSGQESSKALKFLTKDLEEDVRMARKQWVVNEWNALVSALKSFGQVGGEAREVLDRCLKLV